MSNLETSLNQAAEETRRAARHAVPPPLPSTRPAGTHGWLVLAAAFLTVLAVFALVPLLAGPEPGEVGGLPAPTTIGEAPTTTGPENPPTCSSSGVPQPEFIDAGLPPAVSAKAHAISRFAAACDFDGLAGIAAPGFITSFGSEIGVGDLARWETEDRGEVGTLLRILGTSFAVQESEDGRDLYVWPAAFAYERWEDIPEHYREELLVIHSEAELDQFMEFGSYAGWRTGIDEEGNWLFFVAGD